MTLDDEFENMLSSMSVFSTGPRGSNETMLYRGLFMAGASAAARLIKNGSSPEELYSQCEKSVGKALEQAIHNMITRVVAHDNQN